MQKNIPLFGLLQIRMPRTVSHIKKGLFLASAPSFIVDSSKVSAAQKAQRAKFSSAAKAAVNAMSGKTGYQKVKAYNEAIGRQLRK